MKRAPVGGGEGGEEEGKDGAEEGGGGSNGNTGNNGGNSGFYNSRHDDTPLIREVVKSAGLVFSEKSEQQFVLSKPKIMPLKSRAVEEAERRMEGMEAAA